MEYFDISPRIRPGSPVFPGDQAYERHVTMGFEQGDHLGLSWIKSTLHIGAHADAPSHYHRNGASIEQRDLRLYMGRCQVIDVQHVGPRRILPSDVPLDSIEAPRVLFKSCSFQHTEPFQMAFTSLSPELIDALAELGVQLVGIDTPSVDPADSKDLPSHQALYRNDFAVLEGIDLDRVPAGYWKLTALPLALADADASPVRAVLWSMDYNG
ncbi:MAG TPA: cyclase family protein [Oligoflexus sp.]|uniref:cyclase family protein n=1 Tax=Oligoflexus sp. TaxID=1971216 RepID=UPI002D5633AD|nr:cyclase family protein [Oligoflexus sp.]HYX38147.1 cyclase family protein [Oligoflexus sp.]